MRHDSVTERWIRNHADEIAFADGDGQYRFSILRAMYSIAWIETYCKLYQGVQLGSRLELKSFVGEPDWWADDQSPPDIRDISQWVDDDGEFAFIQNLAHAPRNDTEAWCLRRCKAHLDAFENPDVHCDWPFESHTQLYGWETVARHQKWKRRLRRFRSGSFWQPKKNKKSPTLAANACFLLLGDGEQGANVYLAASDGGQARRISGTHTIAMVEMSDVLSQYCKINRNEMSISVAETRSRLEPLASNNSRTVKSLEGLNGSVLIDEVHVVDQKMIDTVSRLGISRAEPLHLEFSTAGDNPNSYGHRRWEEGEENNKTGANLRHLHISYHAPQNLTDVELARDPEKYIRMANPALGHTIELSEVLDDYKNSAKSPQKLNEFKKYRLNIWQRAASSFIVEGQWIAAVATTQSKP